MYEMTMGSLFSGSGGFELAASRSGIEPRWASEIEPLPMLVTRKNFPDIPHHGDINYMDGAKVEAVDVISGGSPCQDMSVAGLRAGLDGSRSSLFREQIRVIKEMRDHDRKQGRTGKSIRPRFMVWENVPGAFSSNRGADFRAVLEETARVADETADVPLPAKGKWQSAGFVMGDSYSIAWRVLDAQFWGVPQRRKRIYLVADFAGVSAPKVLFEREGLSRDPETGRQAGQGTAASTPERARKASGGGIAVENHPNDSRVRISEDGIVQTLSSRMGTGGGNVPLVLSEQTPIAFEERAGRDGGGKGILIQENKTAAIRANYQQDILQPIPIADKATRYKGGGPTRKEDGAGNGLGVGEPGAPANTLTAADRHAVAYAMQAFDQYKESDVASTLKQRDYKDNTDLVVIDYIIRRLTPLECCRLQGFPDDWTDGIAIENPNAATVREWQIAWAEWWRQVGRADGIQLPKDKAQVTKWLADPVSDSGLYKMWGNGIALPCAEYVFEGIAEVLKAEVEV